MTPSADGLAGWRKCAQGEYEPSVDSLGTGHYICDPGHLPAAQWGYYRVARESEVSLLVRTYRTGQVVKYVLVLVWWMVDAGSRETGNDGLSVSPQMLCILKTIMACNKSWSGLEDTGSL